MRTTTNYLTVVLTVLLMLASRATDRNTATVQAQIATAPHAVTIRSIEDVITQWLPDQHLYVRGQLGIGDEQLSRLEAWLDQNGPHWTVVLLQNAQNDMYVTPDRRMYRDMDAVEYALGHGLANRTRFGEFENATTGETDGAVFVLFLEERKFSYYGSDAHDRRDLGEAQWIGELDAPAIRAMRGGGRILDAVKDTVTTINKRLHDAIADEQAQAERVQRERQRAITELHDDIEIARTKIQAVADEAAAFRIAYPQADGELAQPPLDSFRAELAKLEQSADEANVRSLITQASQQISQLDGFLNSYADYRSLEETSTSLRERMAQLANASSVAQPMVAEANDLLEQAVANRARGVRGLGEILDTVNSALNRADESVRAEAARRQREALRRRIIVNTLLVAAALAALALLATLFVLNRRRLPAKRKALQALQERETSVKSEMDNVLQLFSRSGEILGSKERIVERGYAGTTRSLSESAFQHVDDLLIMSNEVERVLSEAREFIAPRAWPAKLRNLFSGTAYEQGINRMSGEPLRFQRNQGLPAILAQEALRSGNGGPPEEITATFEKVFGAFRDRCQTTSQMLDTVENSLVQINDRLGELRTKIDEVTKADHELNEASQHDGFFVLPNLFEKLLPSANADYDSADAIAGSDPVLAMQQYVPAGFRKLDEALTIATVARRARQQVFPLFDQQAPALKAWGYNTEWIQAVIQTLGVQANDLLAVACERPVADEAQQLDMALSDLANRVTQSADLAKQLHETHEPLLPMIESAIQQARQQTGQTLGVDPQRTLHEIDADPDLHLQAARLQLTSAQASLHQGNPSAATQAVEALLQESGRAQAIVDATLKGLQQFDDTLRQQQHLFQKVEQDLPVREKTLPAAQQVFASSALRLQAADPAYPDANATLETHLQHCHDIMRDARHDIQEAQRTYHDGQVLGALRTLQLTDTSLKQADRFLDEIDAHTSRLEAQTRSNQATVRLLQDRLRDLSAHVNDRRTMQSTLTEYSQAASAVELVERQINQSATARDPFQNATMLTELSHRLAQLESAVAADRNAHTEASRAVTGAEGQLAIATRFVEQARNDGIPDSSTTTLSIQEIRSLGDSVQGLRRQLDVAHGDWKLIDDQAAHLHAQLGIEAGRLRGELDRAQQSAAALEQASREVYRASGWTGRYGIRIGGTPGVAELERARRALQGGDYNIMIELARAAAIAAQYAIQQAEREVERRQREEERQAEAERRRRQQSSGGGFVIGGGGFGGGHHSSGGGFGGSSSSRSSGGSSSRSSSSGSGFSRSGW